MARRPRRCRRGRAARTGCRPPPTKFWKMWSSSARSRERSRKSKSGCHSPIRRPPVSSSVEAAKAERRAVETDAPVHDRERAAAAGRERRSGPRMTDAAGPCSIAIDAAAVGSSDAALGPVQRRRERDGPREARPGETDVPEETLERDAARLDGQRHGLGAPVRPREVLDAERAGRLAALVARPRDVGDQGLRRGRDRPPRAPRAGNDCASIREEVSRPAKRKPADGGIRSCPVTRASPAKPRSERKIRSTSATWKLAGHGQQGERMVEVLHGARAVELSERAGDLRGSRGRGPAPDRGGSAGRAQKTSGSASGIPSVALRASSSPR